MYLCGETAWIKKNKNQNHENVRLHVIVFLPRLFLMNCFIERYKDELFKSACPGAFVDSGEFVGDAGNNIGEHKMAHPRFRGAGEIPDMLS